MNISSPSRDLSLKAGEKIKINIPKKKEKSENSSFSSNSSFLPPPPEARNFSTDSNTNNVFSSFSNKSDNLSDHSNSFSRYDTLNNC